MGQASRSPAPWLALIIASPFKLWPTRYGAVCELCAAISGCSAPDILKIYRCAFAKSCLTPTADGGYPILAERTSVRMDFSHSGWSDIFFLGMDFPEGARVINASIDWLSRPSRIAANTIESAIRVIDEPVLRLVSLDLDACAEITRLVDVYDFGADYLGLLKAAVIAAGLIPRVWKAAMSRSKNCSLN